MSELVVGSLAGLSDNGFVIDVASGSRLTQPGMIVDVKSVLKTDTFSASLAAQANIAVTGLSITHTLKNASNKLFISAYFGAAASSAQGGNTGLAVADDGTLIGIGNADGSRTRVGSGGITTTGTANAIVAMPSVTFVYEPGDTASHTYTVRAINMRASTETVYINRTERNDDDAFSTRASSALVIQEVAG